MQAGTRQNDPRAGRLEAKLHEQIVPVVEAAGLDLIEIRLGRGHRGTLVSVFVDRFPGDGGVTIDDCAKVSRRLSALFEVEDPIAGAWELEVSSPGTKRRVRHAADAKRFLGIRARCTLRETAERGKETWIGDIVDGDAHGLTLRVDGGEERTVLWDEVARAALDPTTEQWLELGRRAGQEREDLEP